LANSNQFKCELEIPGEFAEKKKQASISSHQTQKLSQEI
jgi:hypothetical protein